MSYQKIEQVTRFALDGKGETLSADEIVDLFNNSVDKCKRLQELFLSSVDKCDRLHEEIRELKHLVREVGTRLSGSASGVWVSPEHLCKAIDILNAERDKFRTRWVNAKFAVILLALVAIAETAILLGLGLGL